MLKTLHLKYVMLMAGLFTTLLAFNNCSNDAGFELNDNYESIGQQIQQGEEEDSLQVDEPGIVINGGDEFTNDSNVSLSLKPGGPADEMLISEDQSCSNGSWEPYQASKLWKLSKNNQKVTVFVKYREYESEDSTACVEDSIVHDNLAPEVSFPKSLDSTWIADRSLSIRFQATDSGSGVKLTECDTKGNGQYNQCGQTYNIINMVENGNYFLVVRAEDNAGNQSEPKRVSWRPDYTAPTVAFLVTPPSITSDATPSFQMQAVDLGSGVKSYECQLDNAATFSVCSSSLTLSSLQEGNHTLRVRATDNVGHVSQVISYSFTVDLTAPTVTITKWPNPFENSFNASFEFREANNGFASFECRLDDGPFVAGCTSPHSLSVSTQGLHTFYVRGVDAAGNKSAPDSRSWTVDTIKPTVRITGRPQSPSKSLEAQFTFDAQDQGSGIDKVFCGLGNVSLSQSCNLSETITQGLMAGQNTLRVQARDKAGNLSDIATYSWLIDTSGPKITLITHPTSPTGEAVASFTFSVTDASSGVNQSSIACRVDTNPYQACNNSFMSQALEGGEHFFTIKAQDLAGNETTSTPFVWTIDRLPPSINFTLSPKEIEYIGSTPKINFSVSDEAGGSGVDYSSITCLYNGNAYPCSEGVNYSFYASEISSHNFSVMVQDMVGNQAEKTISWQVQHKVVPQQTLLDVEGARPVDILFVVDNSGSMNRERAELGDKLEGMLGKIGGVNWQVAVTTTDMSGDKDREEGRLINLDGNGLRILTASDYQVDPQGVQRIFENAVSPYSSSNPTGLPNGGGDERGIHATSVVVDRALGLVKDNTGYDNSIHNQFIRDNSELTVVVLSDENESSEGDPQKVVYQPQEFLDRFNKQYDSKKGLTFHSIVVMSGDSECKQSGSSHHYGTLYEALSNATGGEISSLCAENYTSHLENIGESVANLAKTATLECEPIDSDGDGNRDIEVTYKAPGDANYSPLNEPFEISGLKLTFTGVEYLPEGSYLFDYNCNE